MSLNLEDMKFEEDKLKETLNWIVKELEKIEVEDKKLKFYIDGIRKEAKGRYNQELSNNEKLYNITHKNYERYIEAKEQPYFGRVDFRQYKRNMESFYIGKFGLGDFTKGEERVIDWRAPVAELYYSGTYGEAYYVAPEGVINGELTLKRKYLIKDGKLIDAFDEGINEIILKQDNEEGSALVDEFLKINLEESTGSKLKDVVATIQREQNQVIRADKNKPLILQGSAGSGKTTVALHRLAFLLYKFKGKLKGSDILVLAPNKLFLDYISQVLPDLGIDDVKQCTFEEIALEITGLKDKVISKDKKLGEIIEFQTEGNKEKYSLIVESSRMKGSMEYKSFLDRYLSFLEAEDIKVTDITVQGHILFKRDEIERLYIKDMSNLPINQRKREIKRYLSLKLKGKISNILDKIDFTYEFMISKEKKANEDSPDRRKRLIELYDERDKRKKEIIKNSEKSFDEYFENWMHHGIKGTYFELFSNDEYFKNINNGSMEETLYKYISDEIISNNEKGIIDSDDLSAIMYLKFKIEGVPEKYKYKHIALDEAQDYSLFQFIVLKDMCLNNSITAVGDIAQGIYYYKGLRDFESLINNVFQGNSDYVVLSQSYRSTVEIIDFANIVLKKLENNIKPAVPVLRHGNPPEVIEFKEDKEFAEQIEKILKVVKDSGRKSTAVIGRTFEECRKINEILKKHSSSKWELIKENDKKIKCERIIVPSYMTKGLEFDCTVIYNCSQENYKEIELDKKLLYVVLTRALHLEYVFFKGKKSKLIVSNRY